MREELVRRFVKHADQNIRDCLGHLFLRHAAVSDRLLPGEPVRILPSTAAIFIGSSRTQVSGVFSVAWIHR